jgi:hypothetical protein
MVIDFLSQLTNDVIPVEDSFLDEHLFASSISTPWFVDIVNYLVAIKLPEHLSPRECDNIVNQCAMYSWVNANLFQKGLDIFIHCCVLKDETYEI